MVKKFFVIFLATVMLLSMLASCGGDTSTPAVSQPQQGAGDTPSRGTWDGAVYTNEHLGLRFVLPDDWSALSEAEIAELAGMTDDILAEFDLSMMADGHIFHEMWAISHTGTNVQILYERLLDANETAEEYIERVSEEIELMGGSLIPDSPATTRLGALDWHSYATVIDIGEGSVSGRQLLHIHDGFAFIIAITYFDGSETAADVLGMFSSL